jgi:C2H2-type zinc finger/Zinc-finger of C2H2 type
MTSFNNHKPVTNQARVQNVSGSINNYFWSPGGPQIPKPNHGKKPSLNKQSTHTTPCKQCSRPFSSPQALQQHLDSGIHEAKCKFCPKSFQDQKSLQQHINAVHNLNCSFCNKRLYTQNSLSQHIAATHRQRPTP